MRSNFGTLSAACALTCWTFSSFAGETTASTAGSEKSALDGVSLGDHVYGPKLDIGDLKGRVVMMEFWGIK